MYKNLAQYSPKKIPNLSKKTKDRIENLLIGIIGSAIWDGTKALYQDRNKPDSVVAKLSTDTLNKREFLENISPINIKEEYVFKRNPSAAEQLFNVSLTLIIEAFGPRDLRTIRYRDALAKAFLSEDRLSLSQGAFLLNLNVIENFGSADPRLNAFALNNLAAVVVAQQRYTKAFQLLYRANTIIRTSSIATKKNELDTLQENQVFLARFK